jgi:N-formylglutamate amidohydrolase
MSAFGRLLLLLVVLLPKCSAVAVEYAPGQTYFGRNQYVEYLAGNLPLILSAPHGGRERPEEIPDRQEGTLAFDTGTQELARSISTEFHARTGGWPHVIICRLSRRKVDCNREIVEAAAGNPHAEQAWREFQAFIDAAQAAVVRQHGRGLYIDLHGHGHQEQQLELGYLHPASAYTSDDATLNEPGLAAASSLRGIAALNRLPYAQLVRGPLSLGTLLDKQGFPATPSASRPIPTIPYFSGGYNTARHGRDAVPLAGLQIETNSRGVRDTPENRAKFAQALYAALDVYLEAHLGVLLKSATSTADSAAAPAPASRRPTPRPRLRLLRRRH